MFMQKVRFVWDILLTCHHMHMEHKKQPENYMVEYYRYDLDFAFFDYLLDCMNCNIDQVFDHLRKSTFEKTYSNIIFPTNDGPQLWHMIDHVQIYPPVQNKSSDERKNLNLLSRRLAIITFKKYGEIGHYKINFKGKRLGDRAIPKIENKANKEKINKG